MVCPSHRQNSTLQLCNETLSSISCFAGNRAGKRNRVIHAFDEHEHLQRVANRNLRDRTVKAPDSAAAASQLHRKRKLEQQENPVKRKKPGRPPGRPPVLLSPGISSKGPLPAGWSVSLKDSKREPGKQYKQYKVGSLPLAFACCQTSAVIGVSDIVSDIVRCS